MRSGLRPRYRVECATPGGDQTFITDGASSSDARARQSTSQGNLRASTTVEVYTSQPRGGAIMIDMLLRGGTIVDPAQGVHEALDLAINGGKIAEVASSISTTDAREVIDVTGTFVTPGLTDIHAHVYRGDNHRDPDLVAGVHAGVTTLADAGGAPCDRLDDRRFVRRKNAACGWTLQSGTTSLPGRWRMRCLDRESARTRSRRTWRFTPATSATGARWSPIGGRRVGASRRSGRCWNSWRCSSNLGTRWTT